MHAGAGFTRWRMQCEAAVAGFGEARRRPGRGGPRLGRRRAGGPRGVLCLYRDSPVLRPVCQRRLVHALLEAGDVAVTPAYIRLDSSLAARASNSPSPPGVAVAGHYADHSGSQAALNSAVKHHSRHKLIRLAVAAIGTGTALVKSRHRRAQACSGTLVGFVVMALLFASACSSSFSGGRERPGPRPRPRRRTVLVDLIVVVAASPASAASA